MRAARLALRHSSGLAPQPRHGLRVIVSGIVQGVYYRDNAIEAASHFDLSGWVRNVEKVAPIISKPRFGWVETVVFRDGAEPHGALDEFLRWCRFEHGPANPIFRASASDYFHFEEELERHRCVERVRVAPFAITAADLTHDGAGPSSLPDLVAGAFRKLETRCARALSLSCLRFAVLILDMSSSFDARRYDDYSQKANYDSQHLPGSRTGDWAWRVDFTGPPCELYEA